MNRKKKKCFTILFFEKNMDNLYFILNNILINFFKELTKYKNGYQQYLNYIQELYYASYYISLNVSMHMHMVTS